jgi:hypothetical protein
MEPAVKVSAMSEGVESDLTWIRAKSSEEKIGFDEIQVGRTINR